VGGNGLPHDAQDFFFDINHSTFVLLAKRAEAIFNLFLGVLCELCGENSKIGLIKAMFLPQQWVS
jgi:hypothetical protein